MNETTPQQNNLLSWYFSVYNQRYISRWAELETFNFQNGLLELYILLMYLHSTAMRNLTKVWKTETGPLQGGRAWSRGPESELFEILPYRDHWVTIQSAEPIWPIRAGLAVLVGWWFNDPFMVGFQTTQILDLWTMLCISPCKGPVSVFHTFVRFLMAVLCLSMDLILILWYVVPSLWPKIGL